MGVAEIDAQHHDLLDLANEVLDSPAPPHAIEKTLTALLEYAAFHFHAEEALMAELDYPQAEAHRTEHQRFAANLLALTARVECGDSEAPTVVGNYLRDWMACHFAETDEQFRAFIRSRLP